MANTYLTRTSGTPTNALKWTFSAWVKLSEVINGDRWLLDFYTDGVNRSQIGWTNDNSKPQLIVYELVSSSASQLFTSAQAFRDTSSFYNIVVSCDRTLATAADRTKIYINGERMTSFHTTPTYPSQNVTGIINTAVGTLIGKYNQSGIYYNGLMSHVNFVDGTAYPASTFGSTDSSTGEWKINTSPSVTYGNNGFFILKDGNSVTDQSGNSNNFTVAGGTLTKTEDCPDNVFCTLNPLGHASANFTLIEGSLYSGGADNNWRSIFGTIGSSSGKYYYEMKVIGHNNEHVGIASADQIAHCSDSSGKFTDNSFGAEGYSYTSGGQKANNGSEVSWGNSYTTNDIIGVAFDLDNSKLYFSKNGTWQESGDPTSGATGTGAAYTLVANKIYLPAMASYNAASNMAFNFGNGYFRTTAISSAGTNASGNGIFEYDVPTGYTALSTKGLNL